MPGSSSTTRIENCWRSARSASSAGLLLSMLLLDSLASSQIWRGAGNSGGAFSQAVFSALAARAYFLLLRQKKVAKEKATPGSAPAARVPCATRTAGRLAKLACGSDRRKPKAPGQPALLSASQGDGKASRGNGSALEKAKTVFLGGRP